MKSFIRTLVSKSKRRYIENGFNLDLTYITPRLIAMACPAEGTESIFRNPMSEVLRFLNVFHHNHFKIVNLCAERDYDPEQLGGNVERIPVEDHQPAPLNEILRFCVLTEEWLAAHESNVVATHCKAGKTSTLIGIAHGPEGTDRDDAELLSSLLTTLPGSHCCAALLCASKNPEWEVFGQGVTLPSQRRYVQYFQDMLYNNMWKLSMPKLLLTNIRFSSSPCWKADVHVVVSCNEGNGSYKLDSVLTALVRRSVVASSKQQKCISYDLQPTWVAGDVKVEFFERKIQRQASNRSMHYKVEEQSIFYTCFNTLFIEGSQFTLTSKDELDRPSSSLDTNFQVVFYFSHSLAEEKEGINVSDRLTAACRDRLSKMRDLNRGDCMHKFEHSLTVSSVLRACYEYAHHNILEELPRHPSSQALYAKSGVHLSLWRRVSSHFSQLLKNVMIDKSEEDQLSFSVRDDNETPS